MLIIISYDIISTKKRNRIVKVLEMYGVRVQKSVFECDVDRQQEWEIYANLSQIMKELRNDNDSIRFYQVCSKCLTQARILGAGKLELREPYLIF